MLPIVRLTPEGREGAMRGMTVSGAGKRLRAAVTGATMLAGLASAPALTEVPSTEDLVVPCDQATMAVAWACGREAQAAYFRDFGLCADLGDRNRRAACVETAGSELKSAQRTCEAQEGARRKVCQALGQTRHDPIIRPADFVGEITNPYFPLQPGTVFVYQGRRTARTITVLKRTVTILGVTCVVVRDTEMLDGEVAEDTFDYYAQDREGNVWYFGEVSLHFDRGVVVSTAGSWIAGVDGARPGLYMPASPKPGSTFRQEFALGEAEDVVQVESVSEPYGTFTNVLKVLEFTPLEPLSRQKKYYAPGVGRVLVVDLATGEFQELVRVERGH
jgi:hypothetical protein